MPSVVVNMQGAEKFLLRKVRGALLDRSGQHDREKIRPYSIVTEVSTARILDPAIEHPSPNFRFSGNLSAYLDPSTYLEKTPSTFLEALCIGQEIAHRDVARERINFFVKFFGKDFGQFFIEAQKTLLNGNAYQDGEHALRH